MCWFVICINRIYIFVLNILQLQFLCLHCCALENKQHLFAYCLEIKLSNIRLKLGLFVWKTFVVCEFLCHLLLSAVE